MFSYASYCPLHKSPLEFGCYDCKLRLCSFCLIEHQTHEFENWPEIESSATSLIEDFTRDFLDQVGISKDSILQSLESRRKILHSQVNFACLLLVKQIKELELNTINQIDFICDKLRELKLKQYFDLPGLGENMLDYIDPSLELIKNWKVSKCLKSYIQLSSQTSVIKQNFKSWKELEREKEFNQDINLMSLEMKNINLQDLLTIKTDAFSYDLLCNETVQEIASSSLEILTCSKYINKEPLEILSNLDKIQVPNIDTVDPGMVSLIITKILYHNTNSFIDVEFYLEQPLFVLFPIKDKIRSLELIGEWKTKRNEAKNDLLCLLTTAPQLKRFSLFSPAYEPLVIDILSNAFKSINFRKLEELSINVIQKNFLSKKELRELITNISYTLHTIKTFKVSSSCEQTLLFELTKKPEDRNPLKLKYFSSPLLDTDRYLREISKYNSVSEFDFSSEGTFTPTYLESAVENLNLLQHIEKFSLMLIHNTLTKPEKEPRFIDIRHLKPLKFSIETLKSLSLILKQFYFLDNILCSIFRKILHLLINIEELSITVIDPFYFLNEDEVDLKLQHDQRSYKKLYKLELCLNYILDSNEITNTMVSLATLPRLEELELKIKGGSEEKGLVENIISPKWKKFSLDLIK